MSAGADQLADAAPACRLPGRLARLLGCEPLLVVLADWLFWDQRVGLSLPVFALAVTLAALVGLARTAGARRLTPGRGAMAAAILSAGLLPMVEDVSLLSVAFGLAGTAVAVEIAVSGAKETWRRRLRNATRRLASGPRLIRRDVALTRKVMGRGRGGARPIRVFLLAWVVPLGLLATFLSLFASANPVIAGWLGDLPLPSWPSLAAIPRAAFWAFVLVVTWPLTRARRSWSDLPPGARPVPSKTASAGGVLAALMSPKAILRTLVACNLLFALQLGLDGAYLWGGLALPHGMGYAAYAHRGAYPLVLTALLSAAFVLVARQPERRRDGPCRLIPSLALIFTGQNVLLVASSVRRLALYVDAYALTELRVAAFAWMLLVAIGLALIMAQSVLDRSNAWLVGRACAAAVAVLYAWCFLDVPATVADYNVDHSAALRGTGPSLDGDAILSLGPGALPALDRYLASAAPGDMRAMLIQRRSWWIVAIAARAQDWRAWSIRAWRLGRYLDTIEVAGRAADPKTPPVPSPDDGP